MVRFNSEHEVFGEAVALSPSRPAVPHPPQRYHVQTSILRATAILGSSSLATIAVGLAAAKVWAVLVGPSGVGHAALLQGVAGVAGNIAGMGLASSVVRFGPALLVSSRRSQFDALVSAAWSLWRWGTFFSVALLLFLADFIVGWLNGAVSRGEVMLTSIMIAANAALVVQNAVINAHHHVAALARVSVFGSILGSASSLVILASFGAPAITTALIANSVAMCAVSFWVYHRIYQPSPDWSDATGFAQSRRELLTYGLPIAASTLFGTGVQYVLPALISNLASQTDVGYFRAASTIATHHMGFLLIALGQDYYPRLTAVRGNLTAITTVFRQQYRFTMLLGLALLLAMLACSQWVIPLCYSRQFAAAGPVLDWYMLGMIFRTASCCMGFLMLATCPGWVNLVAETAFGMTWIATSWWGLRFFGLQGLGVAFTMTYALYTLMVAAILTHFVGRVLGWRQWGLLLLAATALGAALAFKRS